MQSGSKAVFDAQYQLLLQHLTLKGLQPKTIDAYSRAMRRTVWGCASVKACTCS